MKYFLINPLNPLASPFLVSDGPVQKYDWCVMFDDFGNLFLGEEPNQYLGEEAGHHLNNGLRPVVAGFKDLPALDLNGITLIDRVKEVRITIKEDNSISILNSNIKVDMYKYEKVLQKQIEIQIPEEPVFYQEHNHRVVVGIFPLIADWEGGDGNVWRLQLVRINDNSILRTILDIGHISYHLLNMEMKNKTQEDYFRDEVLMYIIKKEYGYGRVNPKTYSAKLNEFISKIEKP